MSSHVYFCAAVAAIGFFHFGYHLGELTNISQVLPCKGIEDKEFPSFLGLPKCIPMSTMQFSFASALIALAGAVGAMWAGGACDKYGRRKTMMLLNVPMLASPLVLAFASNYAMLVIGRLLAGLATGGMLVAVPVYISEVSPTHLRGRTGIFSTIGLGTGLAIAGLLGYFFFEPPYWRIIVGFSVITTVLQIVMLPMAVESPVYLRAAGKTAEATAALAKLGTVADHAPVEQTEVTAESALSEKDASSPSGPADTTPTIREFLTQAKHRPSLQILLLSHATQQLSGINVYFSYSYSILILIFSPAAASLFYVFFSFYNIAANIVPGFLLDRYGRRPLLLFSIFAMGAFAALFALSVEVFDQPYIALVAFVGAATVFATGLSSIPFIITAEVVEPAVAGIAAQVSIVVNTLSNFVILFIFPLILEQLKGWTFLIFTGYLGLMGLIALRILPETKGRSPQQVVADLRAR
ncbi:general substrate transporter [Catenaria anguillulae PL171]|uniref:General substrate transporter n=1 Tax=Catenaria anguillulae PL171 TaxID=765915 RepID=A0A1Y2HBC3_9FUNG|nr:general substrate transporter [Catenaria anguillulae PL171]